ncbi:MAG: electron transfer flavoprotein subunit alpha/FixB family protein [Deltaproteobacteria bacterium]|nr:electron transfer flavoprotein subunit alpha/FixB family protein [Deltaproteobacteria bacterium]
MAENKGVLVLCETKEGKLASISTELLGGGSKLAKDLGQELAAVLVGSGVSNLAQEAIAYGADKVYVVDDPLLKDYQTDTYVPVMEKVAKQAIPQVLIMGQTSIGRDLAPRLAFRLNTAASLGCLELAIDPDSKLLLQTKPVYGGNAQAVFTTESFPQIATVRPKAMAPLAPDQSRKGEVIKIDAGLDASAVRTKVLEKVPEEVAGIKLEDAEVVVSGGRGIGSAEGFQQLEELAKLLKGAVGATRPPCDNGWVPAGAQVGLTGKIVTPELYIAVALSGSSQHMSGCSSAKTIVAINKDPEANIFREARFGVVGDWKKIVPAFTEKLKELLAK